VKEDFLLCMVRACEESFGRYPVQSFYDEHHRTQPILINLVKAAQEYTHHSGSDGEALVRSLCDVIDFYPGHIWKGDHLLLPLADELLREADKHVLIQQFKWIESTVGDDAAREFAAMVAEFPVALDTNLFSR
jgi:hemerythrin-like domain-containing protein